MADLYQFLDKDREKKIKEALKEKEERKREIQEQIKKNKLQEVNFPGFDGKLDLLVNAIRTIPNYQNLKGYVRKNVLPKNLGIDYQELSISIGIPKGVALVILYDLYLDKQEEEIKELEKQGLPIFDDQDIVE